MVTDRNDPRSQGVAQGFPTARMFASSSEESKYWSPEIISHLVPPRPKICTGIGSYLHQDTKLRYAIHIEFLTTLEHVM